MLIPLNEIGILKGLIERLSLRGVNANSFERLARDLGIVDDIEALFFLQGILAILRKLPDKAFSYEGGRRDLLKALQDILDHLVNRLEIAEENNEKEENQ